MSRRWASKVRRGLALPRAEKAELVRVWLQLFEIEALLRLGVSLPRLRRRLGKVRKLVSPRDLEPETLARLVRIAAGAHPLSPLCLARAVCLEARLLRRGVTPELRIGVARDADSLSAHAWIEIDGRVLGEAPGSVRRFAPLVPADSIASD